MLKARDLSTVCNGNYQKATFITMFIACVLFAIVCSDQEIRIWFLSDKNLRVDDFCFTRTTQLVFMDVICFVLLIYLIYV